MDKCIYKSYAQQQYHLTVPLVGESQKRSRTEWNKKE